MPVGFETTIQYRNVFRGYLPLPPADRAGPAGSSSPISASLPTIEEQESATFIGNSNQGLLDGLFMLGWGADYPEVTNFLDYHFGQACTSAFGDCYPSIADPLAVGNSTVRSGSPRSGIRRGEHGHRDRGADGARRAWRVR